MSEPIISVIIPVYNRDNNIADAIESVVGQTCKNWELILVVSAIFSRKMVVFLLHGIWGFETLLVSIFCFWIQMIC